MGSKIQESCEDNLRVFFLGGGLVFIQATKKECIDNADLEIIDKWFDVIKPWSEFDVCNG